MMFRASAPRPLWCQIAQGLVQLLHPHDPVVLVQRLVEAAVPRGRAAIVAQARLRDARGAEALPADLAPLPGFAMAKAERGGAAAARVGVRAHAAGAHLRRGDGRGRQGALAPRHHGVSPPGVAGGHQLLRRQARAQGAEGLQRLRAALRGPVLRRHRHRLAAARARPDAHAVVLEVHLADGADRSLAEPREVVHAVSRCGLRAHGLAGYGVHEVVQAGRELKEEVPAPSHLGLCLGQAALCARAVHVEADGPTVRVNLRSRIHGMKRSDACIALLPRFADAQADLGCRGLHVGGLRHNLFTADPLRRRGGRRAVDLCLGGNQGLLGLAHGGLDHGHRVDDAAVRPTVSAAEHRALALRRRHGQGAEAPIELSQPLLCRPRLLDWLHALRADPVGRIRAGRLQGGGGARSTNGPLAHVAVETLPAAAPHEVEAATRAKVTGRIRHG
mmetsp:Transcript_56751/g.164640  ORF Transcript_56751/g.164640 Transcript_56751/m.164640 type:complete len:446 (-) Transcript_56751:137-1474(-)